MKYLIAIFVLLNSVVLAFGDSQTNLPNLEQPRPHVYTSGQPTENGFRQLAAVGIKTVINVLPEKECLPEEMQLVTSHNMTYITVPFSTTAFSRKTIERFSMILKAQGNKSVLIHCSTGNHVAGLWFAYRVLMNEASLATALKEARKIGLQPALEDALFIWVVPESEIMEDEIDAKAS